jgi:hypothetical protein
VPVAVWPGERLRSEEHPQPQNQTFNPKTNKYFGLLVSYQPALTVYRKDLWGEVRWTLDSWEDILAGGRWMFQSVKSAPRAQYDRFHFHPQSLSV